MGLLKKIGTAVKSTFTRVTSAVNDAAKTLTKSNIPLVSGAAKLVDGLIDDNTIEAMKAAATRDGGTKVSEVENTIIAAAQEKGVTDVAAIAEAIKVTTQKVSAETATTIDDNGAVVKVSTWDKIKAFAKKYAKWLIGGVVVLVLGLVIWLCTRKGGKKRYRR